MAERFALQQDLARAVLALDPLSRRLILLRFHAGLTLQEVAARVDLPRSTVDARIQRALTRLRQRLARDRSGQGRWGALTPVLAGLLVPRRAGLLAGGLLAIGGLVLLGARVDRAPGPARGLPAAVAGHGPPSEPAPHPAVRFVPAARERPQAAQPHPPGTAEVRLRLFDPQGRGLAGIPVSLEAVGYPRGPSSHARADERGWVHFAEVPAGLHLLRPDRALSRGLDLAAGEHHERSWILTGPDLVGRVVDAAGAPVEGAQVWVSATPAQWFEGWDWVRDVRDDVDAARTDAAGRFRIPAAGAVRLVGAHASGHGPAPTRAVGPVRGEELVLTLGAETGALSLRLEGADGRPVTRALVWLETVEGQAPAVTPLLARGPDADGAFRFPSVQPGPRDLYVLAPGHAPWTGNVWIEGGGATSVTLGLTAEAVVLGRLWDSAGRSAGAGLLVTASAPGDPGLPSRSRTWTATTDPGGSFRLGGLPAGVLRLTADLGADGRAEVTVEAVAGAVRGVDLRAVAEPPVQGVVVDRTGVPLGGLVLQVQQPSGVTLRTLNRADGTFELAVEGRQPAYVAALEGGCSVGGRWVEPGERGVTLVVDPARRPRCVLAGRLQEPGGQAIAEGYLRLQGSGPYPSPIRAALAPDGGFATPRLQPGVYSIALVQGELVRPVYGGRVEVGFTERQDLGRSTPPEPAWLELSLDPAATVGARLVSWRLRDGHGTVLRGADEHPLPAEGPLRLPVPAGEVQLELWTPRSLPWHRVLHLTAGETRALAVDLAPGTACSLTLEPPTGAALSWLHLEVSDAAERRVLDLDLTPRLQFGERGYRLATGLAPGAYRLRAAARGLRLERRFEVLPGRDVLGLDLDLEPDAGP